MKLYVLDASVVGLAQQRDPTYLHRLEKLPAGKPVVVKTSKAFTWTATSYYSFETRTEEVLK